MSEKKHKREPANPAELSLPEDWGFVLEPAKIEIGSGYAVSLSYDEDGNPIVDVKTYGEVDSAKIRRDIERLYPNAQIRNLNEPTVTVVRKSPRKGKRKTGRK
ncbi:MAG: hypothetical protein QHH12_05690 [Candidatus Bathyarchaeota archaeon]|jgi:hypothetical protein|nr:hypothetical protein [Candidatus Bathyarchaeota archaeon A05DMB-3]MDH7607238.1 hypothetical protein [Candidatus Bathyarchaeota archaeon]